MGLTKFLSHFTFYYLKKISYNCTEVLIYFRCFSRKVWWIFLAQYFVVVVCLTLDSLDDIARVGRIQGRKNLLATHSSGSGRCGDILVIHPRNKPNPLSPLQFPLSSVSLYSAAHPTSVTAVCRRQQHYIRHKKNIDNGKTLGCLLFFTD